MIRVLHNEPTFSALFLTYILARNIRIQEDLVDQLFNSSEKRLARVLLLMAHFGKEAKSEVLIPKISQEMLAEMIGTTRSRVSFFMNRFRKLGFLEYNGMASMCTAPSSISSSRLDSLIRLLLPTQLWASIDTFPASTIYRLRSVYEFEGASLQVGAGYCVRAWCQHSPL